MDLPYFSRLEEIMSRRNNGVRFEGGLWITAIECRAEGLAVRFKVRTDRSWLGGHHNCLALTRMAAETLAFVLVHQVMTKQVALDARHLNIKAIIDALKDQHPVQATFDGWMWTGCDVKEINALADTVIFHVGSQERQAAKELIEPIDLFFKKQLQPTLMAQSEQKTIPLNKLRKEGSAPLLEIAIPEVDYDEFFN
jgi:hypothetical protein